MTENDNPGGAGAALAAHSKDGSTTGSTPASSATGKTWEHSNMSDRVSRLAEQAQDGVEQTAKAVRHAAGDAADILVKQGDRAVDGATNFVRDQPVMAMLATGLVGLALGALLTRR